MIAAFFQQAFKVFNSLSGKLSQPDIADASFYTISKRRLAYRDFTPQKALSGSGQERVPVIRVSQGPVKKHILKVFAQWHIYSPRLMLCKYSFHNL